MGKMGRAIAGRLSQQGFDIAGWTRSGFSPSEAEALGISAHFELDALVEASDIIILSLFDDQAVSSVLQKICHHDLTDTLIADMSTVSPKTLLGAINLVTEAKGTAIDAPISGWPSMVVQGTAGIYIGGSPEDVARFRPVAEALSNRIHHVGELGQGAAVKIVNNMMLAGYWQCLKEAMQVGKKAGLSAEKMLEILVGSPAANGSLAAKASVILGQSDAVSFTATGIAKDTELFTRVAQEFGIEAPAISAAFASYTAHCNAGYGSDDFVTMVRAALASQE